jgi:hypothetical protein
MNFYLEGLVRLFPGWLVVCGFLVWDAPKDPLGQTLVFGTLVTLLLFPVIIPITWLLWVLCVTFKNEFFPQGLPTLRARRQAPHT